MSRNQLSRLSWRTCVAMVGALLGVTSVAQADLLNGGGNGLIVFGVADYGPPIVFGAPTYIPNNFTLINDVLTSPGGGFQTADTSIGNNIFQVGPAFTPFFGWRIGGGNGNGVFGSGAVNITGPAVGFSLSDANPDGFGAASYEIASWHQTYIANGNTPTIFGSWLGIQGVLTSPLSSVAVALRTRVSDTMGLWNNFDLPELVLATGFTNSVAIGGPAGNNAVINLNPFTGAFAGLAINNLGLVNIPNGDIITVTSTLTVIADPAELSVLADPDQSLIAQTGTTLPDTAFTAMTVVPGPASITLMILSGALMVRRRRN
ncbi:MAG: hypothetical protein Kow0022_12870 [Phycisphaerales bacterium]